VATVVVVQVLCLTECFNRIMTERCDVVASMAAVHSQFHFKMFMIFSLHSDTISHRRCLKHAAEEQNKKRRLR
jgi:hypothetical protein